jgi:uncharacterized protein (TIGR02231 family)
MKNNYLLITFLFLTLTVFGQKPIFTSAKVKSAIVYFNAAELSQTISLNLPAGTSTIVVKNVANYMDENTIQIAVPSWVTVLSTQFIVHKVSEYEIDESDPATKKVRDSISLVQKEISKIQVDKLSYTKTIELLDKNQQVNGANDLNVAELIKMVDYYKIKRSDLSNTLNSLAEKESNWNKKLAGLNSKLEVNSTNEDKISNGILVLQVMNDKAGLVDFNINYLTNTARWSPFYELRANNVTSPISMIYKAQIVQNTGVDWKKVKLSLSSGSPNQNNTAPVLQTWFLSYYNPNKDTNFGNKIISEAAETSAYTTKKPKLREMLVDYSLERTTLSDNTQINENQLNVSFDIDLPYDVLSNGNIHSVALKDIKLPATYKYYAAPKVDTDAFLLAEVNDYSKYNLLPGKANVIFEGLYIGKLNINPGQTKDSLSLSMGRDKKISILREKVADKSGTKFLSSYKEQIFTYDITVRNNKKEKIELKLEDQYPVSTNTDITIELLENGNAKTNKETGILTWNLKLSENETKKIRISYKVKSPKDLTINNLY